MEYPNDALLSPNLITLRNTLIKTACSLFETTEEIIYNTRRHPNPEIRFSIYRIMRDAGYTFYEIGQAMGKKHCSIIYGCKLVQDNNEHHFDKKLEYIYNTIKSTYKDGSHQIVITNKEAIKDWLTISNLPEEYVTTLMDNVDMLVKWKSSRESNQSLSY